MRRAAELPAGGFAGEALALSEDGSVVGGGTSSSGAVEEAVVYDAVQGLRPVEGLPPDLMSSSAYGVSADGSVVIGSTLSSIAVPAFEQAFIQDETDGFRRIGDLTGG
jgi:uncharacterized membrane protein